MKALIFGGTGAIGIPVVKLLVKHGHDVYVTSRRNIKSEKDNLHYICGNAMDLEFIKNFLCQNHEFDVLIDFMAYNTDEFRNRYEYLLTHVGRYLFFSSSRVYADQGNKKITEDSPRLLDVCRDEDYIKTDEYALQKARQENILLGSEYKNWTIIRPYITYNKERLQLGVLEKEEWLYRALHDRTIVFTQDIADKVTSLTYGLDSADRIVKLAEMGEQDNINGQIFHIATEEQIKWIDVFNLYIEVLSNVLGREQKHKMLPNSNRYAKYNRYWQIKYDRLYNRTFDSEKIEKATRDYEYTPIREGLKNELTEFINGDRKFRVQDINWISQGFFDKVSHEITTFNEIPGIKNRIKYLLARYTGFYEIRNLH